MKDSDVISDVISIAREAGAICIPVTSLTTLTANVGPTSTEPEALGLKTWLCTFAFGETKKDVKKLSCILRARWLCKTGSVNILRDHIRLIFLGLQLWLFAPELFLYPRAAKASA